MVHPFRKNEEGEEGKEKKVEDHVAAQMAVRRMVDTLVMAMEKKGIDMTTFKPNHFATLSVYYAMFLRNDKKTFSKRPASVTSLRVSQKSLPPRVLPRNDKETFR